MSGTEISDDSIENRSFEFVLGTMRGSDRQKFEKELRHDDALQQAVNFWEGHLMPMTPSEQRAPAPKTWDNIASHINKSDSIDTPPSRFSFVNFWQWAMPSVAALALMLAIFGYTPNSITTTPDTDYVAVLVSDAGKPLLTAISNAKGKQMWLKWEVENMSDEVDLQLWAKSKRDGEIRPITVFENTGTTTLALTTSSWRLITDAESLILTEEEPGGSAIDEPSEMRIARGVCVRFSKDEQTI